MRAHRNRPRTLACTCFALALALALAGCKALSSLPLLGGGDDAPPDAAPQGVATPGDAQAGADATSAPLTDAERFAALLDSVFFDMLQSDSVSAQYILRDGEDVGEEPKLWGTSPAAAQEEATWLQGIQAQLASIDKRALGAEHAELYAILADWAARNAALGDYPLHANQFARSGGLHSLFPTMMAEYRIETEADADVYLQLLHDAGRMFDDAIAYLRQQADAHTLMSDENLAYVADAARTFLADREGNMLIESFSRRLGESSIPASRTAELETRNREALSSVVYPAYERLAAALDSLAGRGVAGGTSNLPDGQAYYAAMLRAATGSNRSVAELKRMVEQRMQVTAPYRTAPILEMQVDSDPHEVLKRIEGYYIRQFPDPGDVTYTLHTIATDIEDSLAPAFYMDAPLGESGGVIYVRGSLSGAPLFTTLAHEAAGHMYQSAHFAATNPHRIRRVLRYSGYAEGWAMLVEYEAYGWLGDYTALMEECLAMAGREEYALGMAALADIGVNYEGWDMARLAAHYGWGSESAAPLYHYITSKPGVYVKYYAGYLEFLSLRQFAEGALGSAYSGVDFYRAVLDAGECSFAHLAQKVDAYIAGARRAAA